MLCVYMQLAELNLFVGAFLYTNLIPNTAVFGPTNFIGTTIASTRMTVYALDEKGRFLRWPDGAIRKILFIYLFLVNLIYIIFN